MVQVERAFGIRFEAREVSSPQNVGELVALVDKKLALAYGTAELPPLVSDSRDFHAMRAEAHLPGSLIPVPRANHFTIVHELRDPDGLLTRHLPLLLG